MANAKELTQSHLKELLHYNPVTGYFVWNKSLRNNALVGAIAGSVMAAGYIRVGIHGKLYLAHRLAFLYMTGEWPIEHVDHKDMCTSNNKWSNLRECSHSENHLNTFKPSNNTSGYKGVAWNKRANKWSVNIQFGKKYFLGNFNCKHDAAEAYNKKAIELHGEFVRLNKVVR